MTEIMRADRFKLRKTAAENAALTLGNGRLVEIVDSSDAPTGAVAIHNGETAGGISLGGTIAAASPTGKFLRDDGTWQTPSGSGSSGVIALPDETPAEADAGGSTDVLLGVTPMNKLFKWTGSEWQLVLGMIALLLCSLSALAADPPPAYARNLITTNGFTTAAEGLALLEFETALSDGSVSNITIAGTLTANAVSVLGAGETKVEALVSTNSVQMLNVTGNSLAYYTSGKYLTNLVALDFNVPLTQQTSVSNLVDVSKPSSLLTIGGNIAFLYATNGVAGGDQTHSVTMRNYSGSDVTFAVPSGWKTNIYSAVPSKITNGYDTVMHVRAIGATGDAASQTNVQLVGFEYFK